MACLNRVGTTEASSFGLPMRVAKPARNSISSVPLGQVPLMRTSRGHLDLASRSEYVSVPTSVTTPAASMDLKEVTARIGERRSIISPLRIQRSHSCRLNPPENIGRL